MNYTKSKFRVILYYLTTYLIIASVIFLLFYKYSSRAIIIGEIIALFPFIAFSNLIFSELRQSVKVNEESIECRSFVINAKPVDAIIDYSIIEKIEMRHVPLKPFSKCLYLLINDNAPAIISNDYKNYTELWKAICNNYKKSNNYACFDDNVIKWLKKTQNI